MKNWEELKNNLLTAPDRELDKSIFPLIKKASNPPKAIELLEIVDKIIYSSLASGFVLTLFQLMLDEAIAHEKTSLDILIRDAIWRKE